MTLFAAGLPLAAVVPAGTASAASMVPASPSRPHPGSAVHRRQSGGVVPVSIPGRGLPFNCSNAVFRDGAGQRRAPRPDAHSLIHAGKLYAARHARHTYPGQYAYPGQYGYTAAVTGADGAARAGCAGHRPGYRLALPGGGGHRRAVPPPEAVISRPNQLRKAMMKFSISRRTLTTAGAAAVAVPALAAVAGCSASPAHPAAAAPPATAAAMPAPTPTVTVPKYEAADNVRQQVTATACARDGSQGWHLTGMATNTSSSRHGYSIVVDFVTREGDTVLDTKIVKVKPLAPGASARWSAVGAAGHENVACVIRQALAQA
jgi:hypothetical protein